MLKFRRKKFVSDVEIYRMSGCRMLGSDCIYTCITGSYQCTDHSIYYIQVTKSDQYTMPNIIVI